MCKRQNCCKCCSSVNNSETCYEIKERWEKYGKHLYTINELKRDVPSLHKRYIAIQKANYLFIRGCSNGLDKETYNKLKHDIFTEIILWAQKRYNNNNSGIPDVFYDLFTQSTHPLFTPHHDSKLYENEI